MSYPCFCCGKPTKGKTAFYVVTTDGASWMPHADWLALCAGMGYDPKDPDTALDLCGYKWRPESYGSTCYRREKAAAAVKVEIISPKGERFLFIG
jgi:hypothetical protein